MRLRRCLLALPALLALAMPAAAEGLKIATWNLNWLTLRPAGDRALPANVAPKSPEGLAMLRRYAASLDADVVALQEVDGTEVAAKLFPPERYSIHITGDFVVQRTGFAVRRGIAYRAHPDLTDLLGPAGRLRSGADISLDLPAGELRILNVHLKSGCRQDRLTSTLNSTCETLRGQLAPLQGWIAARRDAGVAFLLTGDFNRWMDGGDAFWAGLERTAPLLRATAGKSSPCWGGGGFLDHIIAGGPARFWLDADSLRVLVYRETRPEWKEILSDHCPVSARLLLPKAGVAGAVTAPIR